MDGCKLAGQASGVVFKAKGLTISRSSFVPSLLLLPQHKGSYRHSHGNHGSLCLPTHSHCRAVAVHKPTPLPANRIQPQLSSLFQGLKFLSGSNPDSHICRAVGVGFVEGCEVPAAPITPPAFTAS